MKDDLKEINNEDKVFLAADKTRNMYKVEKEAYNEHLESNITKEYKKAGKNVIRDIIKDDKKIAEALEIDDRLHVTTKRDCYITIKDHKPNYANNPSFRLINPCKSELGMVSKQMLVKIITAVKSKVHLTQWKNSDSVIDWFTNLKNKERLHFIQFDVVKEMYYTDNKPPWTFISLQLRLSFLCSVH